MNPRLPRWLVAIRGDVPLFPRAFPVVEGASHFAALSAAEMLPAIRATGVERTQLVLTRLEGK
jgi:hypothetical protein